MAVRPWWGGARGCVGVCVDMHVCVCEYIYVYKNRIERGKSWVTFSGPLFFFSSFSPAIPSLSSGSLSLFGLNSLGSLSLSGSLPTLG